MNVRKARYPREEFADRGREIYDRRIRSQVEPAENGRVVAVDIDSGEFVVADDVLSACKSLIARNPDAQIWTVRVGRRAVHRIGAWQAPESSK